EEDRERHADPASLARSVRIRCDALMGTMGEGRTRGARDAARVQRGRRDQPRAARTTAARRSRDSATRGTPDRRRISDAYWAERGGKPQPRGRQPLTPDEENHFLVKGSKLFNAHGYYNGHDEWEEVWRRATGPKRRLLHGLIQ